MKIKIVNDRTDNLDQLYLLLTGDSAEGVKGITTGNPIKFNDLASPEINIESIVGARLYVGYGKFPAAPVPDGDQYYGWIEFTKNKDESAVWINLSNVDLTGLPLALAGTDIDGGSFTLGYKKSIQDTISDLKKSVLSPDDDDNPAYITCGTGQPKIVGPNICPAGYTSYDSYINDLNTNKAPLEIMTDTPSGGSAIVFTGGFMNAVADTDVMISLTSGNGDTFEITKGEFTSNICYRCDGGKISYNGNLVDDNQSPQDNDDKLYSNSTFRNIMIGINEGYFTAIGPNVSAAFPGDIPFANGNGSEYAKIIHLNSNSYGFPYADSNLKVLVKALPSDTITLTICTDTEAKNYSTGDNKGSNQPTSGTFQFGIGAGSADLGVITIGDLNWRYTADEGGAYGGFLPELTEWTKMHFEGPGKYIWIKTTGEGEVSATGCFDSVPTYLNKVLTWGAIRNRAGRI